MFDIVTGTSIGAINSSVLIGHYLENNSWDGSDDKLLDFWEGLMCSSIADSLFHSNSLVRIYWDNMKILNQDLTDAENARRFWSIFEFAFSPRGVPNMFKSVPHLGSKFLNPFTDFLPWWKYDFTPLKNYLSKFVNFPIKTRIEDGQSRLLLTSVDIQDFSSTVVFDSYEKLHDAHEKIDLRLDDKGIDNSTRSYDSKLDNNDNSNKNIKKGRWYSEYGNSENRHLIFYDELGVDQVLASTLGKNALNHSHIEDSHTGTIRQLWDWGYLSNTPLRELLTAHRNYWMEYTKINQKKIQETKESCTELIARIPELEVFIVNLHPLTPRDIPTDEDLVDDRENDIFFHDRTAYDEQVAYAFTDFVNMTRDLINLARSKGLSVEIDEILNKKAKTIA